MATQNINAKPLPKTLPGYICRQWKKCGKLICKCARGELHGPYFYRFGWAGGRQFKEYVRLADVEDVRSACQEYRELQAELREGRRSFRAMLALLRQHEQEIRTLMKG